MSAIFPTSPLRPTVAATPVAGASQPASAMPTQALPLPLPLPLPLSLPLTFVLMALWICLGLIGHDPWKSDEAYAFGIVYSMLGSGDWVVPMLAGEAFVEKPPFVYILASITASLTSGVLPLHDGARLASGVLSAVTLLATALSARAIFGGRVGAGRTAALVLAASLGFVMHARTLLTDLGVIAGVAVAIYGFVCVFNHRHVLFSAMLIGTGAGIAFLSKGLVGIAVLGGVAVMLPLLFPVWRTRRYLHILLLALVAALPWLLIWPTALYLRSPQLFHDWFWLNNVGRFLGFAVPALGAGKEAGFLWDTLAWFTFPALPLVAWAWWRGELRLRTMPGMQVGVTFVALYLLMMALSSSARVNYLLPLLPPLAMLAVPALRVLPRWVNRVGGAASLLLFGGATLFTWIVWAMAVQKGTPPDWAFLTRHLPADHAFALSIPMLSLAVLLTYAIVAVMVTQWRTPMWALTSWCGGILTFSAAVTLLWMPWLDAAKSYRQPFTAMRAYLPIAADCLSRHRVGEGERAVLHYLTDVVPLRYASDSADSEQPCPFVVVQGLRQDAHALDDVAHERVLWTGARPGDLREQFWLLDLRKAEGKKSSIYAAFRVKVPGTPR
jgi:4-amino-4-deoxy-L-arabinose transferase-like glycosyltransferase